MWQRQLAALVALALGAAAIAMAAILVVSDPLREALRLLLVVGALAAAWQGVRRRGARRFLWLGGGALLLLGDVTLLVMGRPMLVVGLVAALALAIVAGSRAFSARVELPSGARPRRPVLFFNPRSGGGKAERYHLADEARARGIEPVELVPGADLARLVREALDAGADALAMAGGDGSQATVAAMAAERRIPYACIPSGTRNHFALDLGVDRDDVVGALDALVDGSERVVDLAEVNGRVFVNNVSVGLYGDAVQRGTYRDAKIHTLLDTVPDVLGPETSVDLRWRGPDGAGHDGSVAIVVSNNPYRLEPELGTGTGRVWTRPSSGWSSWTRPGRGASCARGRLRRSRSTRTPPCPRASMARHSCSTRRSASESALPPYAAGSPAITPARRRRPSCPRAPGRPFARWPASPWDAIRGRS